MAKILFPTPSQDCNELSVMIRKALIIVLSGCVLSCDEEAEQFHSATEQVADSQERAMSRAEVKMDVKTTIHDNMFARANSNIESDHEEVLSLNAQAQAHEDKGLSIPKALQVQEPDFDVEPMKAIPLRAVPLTPAEYPRSY